MSLKRTRSTTDALQHLTSSFKQFEKKLDKLQEDVSLHGQTLYDLRVMVSNISASSIANPDVQQLETVLNTPKTAAIQSDRPAHSEPLIKTKRKNAIQSFPAQIKARSYPSPGNRMHDNNMPFYHTKLVSSSPKGNTVKHSYKTLRPSKAEAPRKATMLRAGKKVDKKHNKI